MQEFRLDGRQVIRGFQAAQRRYRSPAVMVQDRVVSRIYENGASISLTHNIIQVLSKEGLERWGEVQVPRDAEVLTLRTVKHDGRIMEPEEIIGKDSVSLPDLAVGDFVEVEYLEAHKPSAAADGSAVQKFFFGSPEVPLWRSEFQLLTPATAALHIEYWGGAPLVQRSRRGQETLRRWVVHDQPRLIMEPRSVPLEELLPVVVVTMGGSWERWRSFYRERLDAATRPTWHLSRVADALALGVDEPRRRAQEIYREVLTKVEPEGEIFEDATRTMLGGRGCRTSALMGLLRSADVHAELWLVRPRTASWRVKHVPDVQDFSTPLIRCLLPEGPLFLDPRNKAVPFGYIRPALRGAVGLRIVPEGALFAQVPMRTAQSRDHHGIKIKMELARDGAGRLEVVERHLGLDAQRWRLALQKMDHDAVEKAFEQGTLGFYFPGAELERVTVLNTERHAEPLIVEYSFTAPNLARVVRSGLMVRSGLFAPNLGREYLQLDQRRSPLGVAFHAPLTMEVQIVAPPGMVAVAPAGDISLKTPFGSMRRVSGYRAGRHHAQRWELRLVYGRVSPAQYPAFKRFVREVDASYRQEIFFSDRRPAAPAPRPDH